MSEPLCKTSNSQYQAWAKALERTQDPEARKLLIDKMTASRVADAVARGNEVLKYAENLDGWNTQQAQVNSAMRTTSEELERIDREMSAYANADETDIDAIVATGGKLFFDNAHSVWKDTLYLHESDNFGKEGDSLEFIEELAGFTTLAAGAPIGIFAVYGGSAVALGPGVATQLPWGSLATTTLSAAAVTGSLAAIGFCVYKVGDHLYMKATNEGISDIENCE